MKITWIGNAFFIVETENRRVFIDPWITDNPGVPITVDQAVEMKPDCVLVSHGHPGHFGRGDSIEIANRACVPYVSTFTVTQFLRETGKAKTYCIGLEPGMKVNLDGLDIQVFQVPHPPTPDKMMSGVAPAVPNCIFLLELEGKVLLHVGDTLPDDIYKRISDKYEVDCAMLPLWGAGLGFSKEEAIRNIEDIISIVRPKHIMLHNRWDPALPAYNLFMEKMKGTGLDDRILQQKPGISFEF